MPNLAIFFEAHFGQTLIPPKPLDRSGSNFQRISLSGIWELSQYSPPPHCFVLVVKPNERFPVHGRHGPAQSWELGSFVLQTPADKHRSAWS